MTTRMHAPTPARPMTITEKPRSFSALRRFPSVLTNSSVTLLAILFFIPVAETILISLRTVADISKNGVWSVPSTLTIDAYVEAFPRLMPNYLASFLTTVPTVIVTCIIAAAAAYAISQLRFRSRKFIFLLLVAGAFIPIHVQLIPVFDIMNTLHLYDTYLSLILVQSMRHLGIAVLILTNFFNAVPRDLRNAARVDGAMELQIFWHIYLPLTRPALAALSIFLFTWVWNDLLWGLVLTQSQDKQPITAGIIAFQGEYETQWPLLAAGSLIATLPTIIVFIMFQKHFIKGLTMGSVKG